jgi:hypothetical protein
MNGMVESAKETATKRSTQTTKTQTVTILDLANCAVQLTSPSRELRSLPPVLIISRSELAATVQRPGTIVPEQCADHVLITDCGAMKEKKCNVMHYYVMF